MSVWKIVLLDLFGAILMLLILFGITFISDRNERKKKRDKEQKRLKSET